MAKPSSLSPAEITDRLKALPGWRLESGALVREYQTDGWPTNPSNCGGSSITH